MLSTKIAPIKKSTCAAHQILDSIQRCDHQSGRNPFPERIIASEKDASRSCIRKVLSILHVLGIIEARRSDGTYVPRLAKGEVVMQRAGACKTDIGLLWAWEVQADRNRPGVVGHISERVFLHCRRRQSVLCECENPHTRRIEEHA